MRNKIRVDQAIHECAPYIPKSKTSKLSETSNTSNSKKQQNHSTKTANA